MSLTVVHVHRYQLRGPLAKTNLSLTGLQSELPAAGMTRDRTTSDQASPGRGLFPDTGARSAHQCHGNGMWSGNTMPGAVTIRVRSGSSPLRERPAVEDILGQSGKSGHELGIRQL